MTIVNGHLVMVKNSTNVVVFISGIVGAVALINHIVSIAAGQKL